MKKLFFAVMSMVAMTFASCGNQTTSSSNVNDSDTVVVDSLNSIGVDSAAIDSTVCPD